MNIDKEIEATYLQMYGTMQIQEPDIQNSSHDTSMSRKKKCMYCIVATQLFVGAVEGGMAIAPYVAPGICNSASNPFGVVIGLISCIGGWCLCYNIPEKEYETITEKHKCVVDEFYKNKQVFENAISNSKEQINNLEIKMEINKNLSIEREEKIKKLQNDVIFWEKECAIHVAKYINLEKNRDIEISSNLKKLEEISLSKHTNVLVNSDCEDNFDNDLANVKKSLTESELYFQKKDI